MQGISYKESMGRRIFNVFNVIFLTFVMLSIAIPLLNIVVTSLASDKDVLENSFLLIPKSITFKHYRTILTSGYFAGFFNSIKITIIGVLISIPLTVSMAYALTNDKFPLQSFWSKFIVATMILDGGIIPFYLLIKYLGLLDSHLSIILPLSMSAYNLILVMNYMRSIPKSLAESAKVDGAGELTILAKIIIPVSIPIIAAITLFYAVTLWNNYFYVIMFINKQEKYNIQVLLRSLIIENDPSVTGSESIYDNFKMAVMLMGMLPILVFYPIIQKHFIGGIMLGSIKG